ncbi:rhodanese-like domain-containing protein [Vallitalea okinawensis]|uniref:rhodanese-like domain-containing protein n=1 Tax=Vallitalea okinawensis TaxID=2078660 RepID=UPI001A9A3D11|nr:rhodanese-like domain-containing protein [Vallitalea okinawensis]
MMKFTKKMALILAMIMVLGTAMVGCSSEEKKVEEKVEEPAQSAMVVDETKVSEVEKGVNAYFANMPEHIYKINQKEFIEKVNAGEDMFILDIRTAEDYAAGHVKGAYNAPWGTAISDSLSKIPSDVPVYVYCYSGQTAGQTVMTLNLAGFNARSVNLGWNFGISKVEGYESVSVTDANEFGEDVTEINAEVQTALDAYYAGLADVKETTFKNYKVSEDNLKAMIDNKDDFYLLSIRSAEDFANGHIDGAENIPWGAGMEQSFSNLPKDKTIVVYCYSGQTAGQTVAGLRLLGYDAVSLNGGVGVGSNAPLGWANKGYELVK